jgi:endonuclease/exonuclease/phosphatase family metal-dependent hydrolase
MSTFRLATLNAHSFCNSYSSIDGNKVSALASILLPFNLDLIAVQEIQNNNRWKEFCSDLSFLHSSYGQCNGDFFGNGIASRYPIVSPVNQQSLIKSERRSLFQCRLDGDHPFIQNRVFAVTHLDHVNEDDRLKQIQGFDSFHDTIDILMGDMNALTRDDYSDEYFQKQIIEVREESRWEKPRFDLTKLITNEWRYQDAYRLINAEAKDAQISTCYYGTRIDYIYVHPRVINDQWIIKQCEIIDTKGFTDHQAVFAEFELKSN